MIEEEKIIKHLEMIQVVINRLAGNSFSIKTWSVTVIAALIFFIARSDMPLNCFFWFFIIPVILFWVLDGYFLWQEQVFRGVYDDVRVKASTDFAMRPNPANLKWGKWLRATFSPTLCLFYLTQCMVLSLLTGKFFAHWLILCQSGGEVVKGGGVILLLFCNAGK